MATSPTARTLAWLRKQGWTAGVVEKWIPQTQRRIDYLGGIDIIAIRDRTTLGIQATTATNQAARCKKLLGLPEMRIWVDAGNLLWVVAWSQRRTKAGRRRLWCPTVTEITLNGPQHGAVNAEEALTRPANKEQGHG